MGNDKSIAEAAWTSSTELSKKLVKTDNDVEKLVYRLAADGHSVPFESVVLRFWYYLPIQTDRQHMTHRIASHSGMSGRYRTMPKDWLHAPDDILDIISAIPDGQDLINDYEDHCNASNLFYERAINRLKAARDNEKVINAADYKRCREFLRGVLPQNNMTERVSIFNLRSFANYYRLRSDAAAQPEIQLLAIGMMQQLIEKNVCPIAVKALENNDWKI